MCLSFNITSYLFAQEKKTKQNTGCLALGARRALQVFISTYFAWALLNGPTFLFLWKNKTFYHFMVPFSATSAAANQSGPW